MLPSSPSLTKPARNPTTRQVTRADELLQIAISVLGESNEEAIQAAQSHCANASVSLRAALAEQTPIDEAATRAHEQLMEAQQAARSMNLNSREEQCLDAVIRAMTLLYPLTQRTPQTKFREQTGEEAPPSHDRRHNQRVYLETHVGFESENNFYTGFTEDISEGGLFLATHNLLPMGTEIDLSFQLPDESIVNILGRVRWVREPRSWEDQETQPGMGIQFEDVTPETRDAIQMFVEMRAPLFYDD